MVDLNLVQSMQGIGPKLLGLRQCYIQVDCVALVARFLNSGERFYAMPPVYAYYLCSTTLPLNRLILSPVEGQV